MFSVYLEARYLSISTLDDFERLLQLFLTLEAENQKLLQFAEVTQQLSRESSSTFLERGRSELRLSELDYKLRAVDDEILLRFVMTLWSATVYRIATDPQLWCDAFTDLLAVLGFNLSRGVRRLFITQDEVVLLLLSVLKPGEADSTEALVKIATKELSKMKCKRGCLSLSHFITYLVQQGTDSRALMGTVYTLRNMDSGVSFINCALTTIHDLDVGEKEGEEILQTMLCNPKLQEIKCGAAIDSNLTLQMTTIHFNAYNSQQREGLTENERHNQIEMVFEHTNMLYLQNIEAFLHRLNSNSMSIQDEYLSKVVVPDPMDGMRWEDLKIDELIMQADWVELPLGGKLD